MTLIHLYRSCFISSLKHRKPKLEGLISFSVLHCSPMAKLERETLALNSLSCAQTIGHYSFNTISKFSVLILYLCVMFNLHNTFHQQSEKVGKQTRILTCILAISEREEQIANPEPCVKLQDPHLPPYPSLLSKTFRTEVKNKPWSSNTCGKKSLTKKSKEPRRSSTLTQIRTFLYTMHLWQTLFLFLQIHYKY